MTISQLLNGVANSIFRSTVNQLITIANALKPVATSGDYNDLSNQPVIPTHTSDLTNNSTFQTAADIAPIQSEVNALVETIANLAVASGEIASEYSPVFAPIPLTLTDIPFGVITDTSDATVFELDGIANTITFRKDGNFSFFPTIVVQTWGGQANTNLTFGLVDVSTGLVFKSVTALIDLTNSTSQSITLPMLITATAGLTMKVQCKVDDDIYLSLLSFHSTLTSAAGVGAAGVDLTSDQDIAGVKTFASSPIVPDATQPAQAASYGQLTTALGDIETALTTINGV